MTQRAWVSGWAGWYVLHVEANKSTSQFARLDGMTFTKYRAAQDIANAIKAYARKHK